MPNQFIHNGNSAFSFDAKLYMLYTMLKYSAVRKLNNYIVLFYAILLQERRNTTICNGVFYIEPHYVKVIAKARDTRSKTIVNVGVPRNVMAPEIY